MSKEWEVSITVPMRIGAAQRDSLFNAICEAVDKWENNLPLQGKDWDAFVAGHPYEDLTELRDEVAHWKNSYETMGRSIANTILKNR